MNKIVDIELQHDFKILCVFENGERKVLDLERVLDKSNKFVSKVLDESIFPKIKLGSFGQIYWDGIAEITNLDGTIESCEYDISPEFAYHHSTTIS